MPLQLKTSMPMTLLFKALYHLKGLYSKKGIVCLSFGHTFSCTITHFGVKNTQVLIQTFKTRGKNMPITIT